MRRGLAITVLTAMLATSSGCITMGVASTKKSKAAVIGGLVGVAGNFVVAAGTSYAYGKGDEGPPKYPRYWTWVGAVFVLDALALYNLTRAQ